MQFVTRISNNIGENSSDSKCIKMKNNTTNSQRFKAGNSFININNNRIGIVDRLRDDSYERSLRKIDMCHYYYSVTYADGTFETYLSQSYMSLSIQ